MRFFFFSWRSFTDDVVGSRRCWFFVLRRKQAAGTANAHRIMHLLVCRCCDMILSAFAFSVLQSNKRGAAYVDIAGQ